MRHLMAYCLALGLLANRASGQEVPELTKARQKAVNELIEAGIKDGAFAVAETPDGRENYLRVVDRAKLKAMLAARKDNLAAELRDGLTASWFNTNEPSEPAL